MLYLISSLDLTCFNVWLVSGALLLSADDSYDMAPPIHSIDDKYVTNYVREVEAKAYGKALDDPLDHVPDSPAWFKKENCRTTTMDSYLQVCDNEIS